MRPHAIKKERRHRGVTKLHIITFESYTQNSHRVFNQRSLPGRPAPARSIPRKSPLSAVLRFFCKLISDHSSHLRYSHPSLVKPLSWHLRHGPRSFGTHTALRCPLPRCGRHLWPTCRAAMPSCPGRSIQSRQDGYRPARLRRQFAAGSAKMCPAGMSGNCRFTIST